ncbi:MAG: tetratricopeptide repeat protein [Gemmatimonadaceae bacterium]
MNKIARSSLATRVGSTSVFVGTILGTIIMIGTMLSLDLFLARVDSTESANHAASEYASGVQLLQEGRAGDAADRFGAAVAINRSNVDYALALGEAQLDDGRTDEAEATIKALLERAGNDGAVNLTMAHVLEREGRVQEAKAYFHRAIFGRWGADSIAQRRRTRFELIDLLAKHGGGAELLAELLPFEETPVDSVALRRRLGHLYNLAGSPARAANMFREVLRRDPSDADAYAGMGDAALALGNFKTARADLEAASRLNPGNTQLAQRLAVADTAAQLDPTARGIEAADRYARSRALLIRTLGAVAACGLASPLVDSTTALLGRPSNAKKSDAAGDALLSRATELWAARPARCNSAARDEVLRLLQSRLAQ